MSILFCEMEVKCDMSWEELKETNDKKIRDCGKCKKSVHFITSQDELEEAAMEGTCVAFYKDSEMPQFLVDQYNRIRDLNKPYSAELPSMTLGRPSPRNTDKNPRAFIDEFYSKNYD
jgi:hypothetical protein